MLYGHGDKFFNKQKLSFGICVWRFLHLWEIIWIGKKWQKKKNTPIIQELVTYDFINRDTNQNVFSSVCTYNTFKAREEKFFYGDHPGVYTVKVAKRFLNKRFKLKRWKLCDVHTRDFPMRFLVRRLRFNIEALFV